MPITPFPPAPSRADPANFADEADAYLSHLENPFVGQANALEANVNAKELAASASATAAAASELAAANTANVSAWVSGTTYAVGVNRYDTTDFLTYRRKTAGAGTTRPGLDSTNWQLLTGLGDISSLSLADPTGSALVGFQQSGAGAVARTVEDKLWESVSVKDFGAVGDGVTDDVLAIQAAINSGAKKIIAPAGKIFRITNTLLIDSNSVELDFQYSELLLDDAGGTKDHIMLGNGVTQRGGIKIHNVIFTRQQVATAGYAINSDFIGVCEIKGCRVYGNNEIHGGIKIYRGIIINIQNNYIDNCVNFGIYLQGANSGAGRTIDVTMRENRVEGGVTALNTWDFVEGVFCRDNIFFNTSSSCVSVNASTSTNGLVSFKFQENDFDTSAGPGFYIDNVGNVQITGCWFSNIAGICLDVASNTDSIIIDANQMYGSNHGIRVAGQTSRISNNLISGGSSCVLVKATARNTAIASNTLCNAAYAVNLAETCTDVQVTDNYCFNMSSGIFTGEVPGTRISITNNKGDPGFGAADYITVGASPFTYTAGPRPEQVFVFSGTKTGIAMGGTLLMGSSDTSITLAPNQSIVVTYTAVPTMSRHFV